jgi:hypothetical protein
VLACADDIDAQAAQLRPGEYGLRSLPVDELLAADDIELVVYLSATSCGVTSPVIVTSWLFPAKPVIRCGPDLTATGAAANT